MAIDVKLVDREITPSLRFVRKVGHFVDPDAAFRCPWLFMGHIALSSMCVQQPCACQLSPTYQPRPQEAFVSVLMRRIIYGTKKRKVHFMIGQCPACSRVYWLIAERE